MTTPVYPVRRTSPSPPPFGAPFLITPRFYLRAGRPAWGPRHWRLSPPPGACGKAGRQARSGAAYSRLRVKTGGQGEGWGEEGVGEGVWLCGDSPQRHQLPFFFVQRHQKGLVTLLRFAQLTQHVPRHSAISATAPTAAAAHAAAAAAATTAASLDAAGPVILLRGIQESRVRQKGQ